MSTAATQLPIDTASNDQGTEIQRVFELQRATALRLRTSTAAERIAKIKRLKESVLANIEAFYEAAEQDFKLSLIHI